MPRFGASAPATGPIEYSPLPSDDHCQASSLPAWRVIDVDAVGDHEGRIEADAELADELGVVLGGLEPFQEGARAGARDRAQRLGHLVAAHADAVVLDGEALVVRIGADGDARLRIVAEQLGPLDRLVAQLLAGIGRVGDQLAQEDVAVRIDRVDHEVEEPRNVGFEGFGFGGFGVGGHEEGHGVRIFGAGNGGSCGDFQGEFEGAGSLRSSTDRAVTRSGGPRQATPRF